MSLDQAIAASKVFAEVAAAVAWPLVVLAIALLFRSTIKSLFARVREIRATGLELVLQQLEQQGQLPVSGRAELQGLSAHDTWALDTFGKGTPVPVEAMSNAQRVAARTLLDVGLLVLKGSGAERAVEVTPLGRKLLEAARALL